MLRPKNRFATFTQAMRRTRAAAPHENKERGAGFTYHVIEEGNDRDEAVVVLRVAVTRRGKMHLEGGGVLGCESELQLSKRHETLHQQPGPDE